MKREITVGLDASGKIQAAHIDTGVPGRRFCQHGGLSPMVVEWDGHSPMFGRAPEEIKEA